MTDFENSQIDSFDVIRKICRDNMSVLSAFVPFNPVFEEFEDLMTGLESARVEQYDKSKGVTISKQKRRKELETATFVLSSKLYVYAKSAVLEELERRVKYTPSDLKYALEKELGGICHQLTNDANANLAGLAPFGIDSGWMSAYVAKIDAFLSLVGAPRSAIEDTKKATAAIKRLIPEISTLLREKLDPIMVHFDETHHSLYGVYKLGRKIVRQGSRSPALKGHVTDSEGNPIKGLIVRIAGTTRKSITSAKGNFRFIQMKMGKVTVVVFDKKKELVRKEVGVPHEGILNLEI
jgi:hypothetical protein